jgi:dipicolinate synthase subunit A
MGNEMPKRVIAILGGDARELRVAERLMDMGHEVRIYGLEKLPNPPVPYSATAAGAVAGAHWVIAPAPGISGDAIFSPFAAQTPILLVEDLLKNTKISEGGLILGRSSASMNEASKNLKFRIIESKDERHLAVANSNTVAEGLLKQLIEKTDKTLREYTFSVLGYGATGVAITDVLLGLKAKVIVATRNKVAQERARQVGAIAYDWEQRLEAMINSDIIINTAPDTSTIQVADYKKLSGKMIVDIASPPGGMDHDKDAESGLNIVWARGLGNRAPTSTGDIRFGFIKEVLDTHDPF